MTKRGPHSASKANGSEPRLKVDDTRDAEAAYSAAREAYIARLTTPPKQRFGEIPGYQPEWFREAYKAERASIDFEDPAYLRLLATLSAMDDGDYGPLAAMLKERAELPALIRRKLVFLIEGDAEQSGGYRLKQVSHPDVDGRNEGRTKAMRQHIRDWSIAAFIASKGGHDGQLEAAIADAKDFFSLGRTVLMKIWSEYKDEVVDFGGNHKD